MRAVALVGPGRAGTSIATALRQAGVPTVAVAGRAVDAPSTVAAAALLRAEAVTVERAGRGADLVVLATPDTAIDEVAAEVAASLEPGALVLHLAGARGLEALAPIAATRDDVHLGALHPLQTLPDADAGATRIAGSWAAVAGHERVTDVTELLGMQPMHVPDEHRAAYHAAACVAANHLVALLAHVERIAERAGVPLAAFEPLVEATVENVFAMGVARALTGPVSRGDATTVARHLEALPPEEREAYRTLADAARRVAGLDDAALNVLLAPVEDPA
jgi:predicted short-subunit dehydrogenase-like oxidoreductase (DUF2520 family)